MFSLILGTEDPALSLIVIEAAFIALLGLCFGSFASAIIYRVPRGLPWAASKERSKCPECGATLTACDLIPVVSWLINNGKCRHCGSPIPAFYPLLELSSAALCLIIFFFNEGTPAETYLFILAVPFLLALFVIDLQHKILPNQLVAIFAGIGGLVLIQKALWSYNIPELLWYFIGGALLFGLFSFALGWIMQKLLKKDALGMGDVKFFAASGLWLGALALGPFCMLSGILGVILGIIWQIRTKQAAFPFGPALIISFFLMNLNPSFFTLKTLQYMQ